MAPSGTLVLVVGSSGSGKSALLRQARTLHPEMVFPVSCTTRERRPLEVEGENYYFLSEDEFSARIAAGDFLEWAEYGGYRYGTLRSEVLPALHEGGVVLREVDVQGARHLRELLPEVRIVVIYIHAGSWESLAGRIRARAPITDMDLEARRLRYESEQEFLPEATYVIENPDGKFREADTAFASLLAEVQASA